MNQTELQNTLSDRNWDLYPFDGFCVRFDCFWVRFETISVRAFFMIFKDKSHITWIWLFFLQKFGMLQICP